MSYFQRSEVQMTQAFRHVDMPYAAQQFFDIRQAWHAVPDRSDMPYAGMHFFFKAASSYNCGSFIECIIFYEYDSEAEILFIKKHSSFVK